MYDKEKYKNGKRFAMCVDMRLYHKEGKYTISISIGESYYETDPYPRKDYALCEAMGYLEGVKIHIDRTLAHIVENIEKEE